MRVTLPPQLHLTCPACRHGFAVQVIDLGLPRLHCPFCQTQFPVYYALRGQIRRKLYYALRDHVEHTVYRRCHQHGDHFDAWSPPSQT